MNKRETEFERQRMQINRAELIERMMRLTSGDKSLEDGLLEAYPGVFLARSSTPTEPVHSVFKPAFCVVPQGSKEMLLGEEVFRYDPGHYLISTVDLPTISHVVEASKEKPYLSFRLDLDPTVVASVLMESRIKIKKGDMSIKAMNVSPIDAELLDAVAKLVRLLDNLEEMKFLAPQIIREIIYRLLKGEQGARLSHLLVSEGDTRRISKAVKQLREHIDEPLKIENMARELGMSVSGFHHHFKSVTAMSPLQFQKQIRLQEARRLMLGEDLDVAVASSRVGYEDPSYFSRDYKKLFGSPPQRDIQRLRSNLEV
ncbi:MAG: AraC family transcriptional regulator [Acidobacteriota bacterium]|nr:AraC family transcriptional regulator [Acidobacteriota bacterium]